jgi:two-component system, chemotaxis family, protein-glutamate methylesterase/glutaminase
LVAGRLRLGAEDPISFQRPSGTALFQSMARDLRGGALGVLLTGMGDDGASGLLDIRRSGGYTIAEDESTAVVYGMPAAAVRMGAVCESLPLPAIARRVSELAPCKLS